MSIAQSHRASIRTDSINALLAAYVVFLSMIQVVTIALSLGRVVLTPTVAAGDILVSLVVGLAVWRLGANGGAFARSSATGRPGGSRIWLILTGVFAALTYGLYGVVSYYQPDSSWDGNYYHIPSIGTWAVKGYIYWIPSNWPQASLMNGYPKGAELVGFVLSQGLRNSYFVNLSNFLFLPLGILGIISLSRSLGASLEAATLSGLAFMAVPTVVFQLPTSYVDVAFACCVIAVMAAVLVIVDDLFAGRSISPRSLLMFGGSLGLSLSTKDTGLGIVVVSVGGIVAVLAVNLAKRAWRERYLGLWRGILFLAGTLAVALIVGGYWYIRDLLLAGSPIYPIGVRFLGHTVFPGASVSEVINATAMTPVFMRSWPEPVQVIYTWLQGLNAWPGSLTSVDARLGGLGYLWLFACVPSMVILLYRSVQLRRPYVHRGRVLVLLGVVGVAFALTPMSWWARYTVWIYAAGLPSLAAIGDEVWSRGSSGQAVSGWSRLRRVWLLVVAAMVVVEGGLSLVGVASASRVSYPYASLKSGFPRVLSARNWSRPTVDLSAYPNVRGTELESVMKQCRPVAVNFVDGTDESLLFGPLSLPLGCRRIIPLQGSGGDTDIRALLGLGVKYVIWDDRISVPPDVKKSSETAVHVDERRSGVWIFALADGVNGAPAAP